MKKAELQKEVDKLHWLQRLELPTDEGDIIVTPYEFDHCTEEIANERYGIPEDLGFKNVIDIGANCGFHSFLAYKRGAFVCSLEPNQGGGDNIKCFDLGRKALGYNVQLFKIDLVSYVEKHPGIKYNISFLFGVLYHVENPIELLKALYAVTIEYALIETAVSPEIQMNGKPLSIWQFNQGHDGDSSNYFYPNLTGLTNALKYVGFSQVELIYNMDNIRMTVKAIV